MTSAAPRPVARLSSPGAIVAAVPSLCGYPPTDSVVLLSLRGPRRRLGLTARLDLPPAALAADAAQALVGRVLGDGAVAVVVVLYADTQRPAVAEAFAGACAQAGLEVAELLHVAGGRWTSYTCSAGCCPPEGTAVPSVDGLVEAELALEGRAVLGSREELVRALAPPDGSLAALSRARLEAAGARWLRQRQEDGLAAARASAVAGAARALDAVAAGRPVEDGPAAELAVALHDVRVRDEVATWALDRADALQSLVEQVARRTAPPHDAPVCALLAWVAYARGDGGRANVALDRALRTDPGHSLALLLRQALDSGLAPQELRRTLRSTRRALRTPLRRPR